ncbi:MAG: hypothetical protein M1135_00710 [Candidatus Omnitrophica bacterium]|nr:hypothetical protein [Candidatus Omnitrophota bacterium]
MKYFISIIAGMFNGLMVWSFTGWLFQKKTFSGKKYFILFIVFIFLSITSDILAWIIIHK